MLRPLAWMLAGVLTLGVLTLLIMPVEALPAIAPMLGVVAVGTVIVLIAGVRGRNLEQEAEHRQLRQAGEEQEKS